MADSKAVASELKDTWTTLVDSDDGVPLVKVLVKQEQSQTGVAPVDLHPLQRGGDILFSCSELCTEFDVAAKLADQFLQSIQPDEGKYKARADEVSMLQDSDIIQSPSDQDGKISGAVSCSCCAFCANGLTGSSCTDFSGRRGGDHWSCLPSAKQDIQH